MTSGGKGKESRAMYFAWIWAITTFLAPISNAFSPQQTFPPVIWASTGGGWRAMFADVGFANACQQAGLFGADSSIPSSSKLRAMSGASGGSWFALQFFFSPMFYNRVVDSNITNMRSFVVDWMESYLALQKNIPLSSHVCDFVGLFPGQEQASSLCDFAAYYGGNWANYTRDVFDAAAISYKDSAGFADRPLVPENRVAALDTTVLNIQVSVAANTRTIAAHAWQKDTITYLGPNGTLDQLYSMAIPMQYSIQKNRTLYKYAVEEKELPFQVYTGPAPGKFRFSDWEPFYLYPGKGGTILTNGLPKHVRITNYQYKEPFGGKPTVNAMAASSGAGAALASGLVPSFLAQYASIRLNTPGAGNKATAIAQARASYEAKVTGDTAICSQWPQSCGPGDSRLVDGGFQENPTLALTLGQLQQSEGFESSSTLKVFLTNHAPTPTNGGQIMAYFQTTFNTGVTPGDFVWPPGERPSAVDQAVPRRSAQIFQDYMDSDIYRAAFSPIPGTDLITGVFRNLMTVDNAVYGVKAGLRVDIFLFLYNSSIPTVILGAETTAANVEPVADLAASVASSQELVNRIASFINS